MQLEEYDAATQHLECEFLRNSLKQLFLGLLLQQYYGAAVVHEAVTTKKLVLVLGYPRYSASSAERINK